MSVASPPAQQGLSPGVPLPPSAGRPAEACPLCGAPLHPAQEWCLSCGVAARTRLAASPNWKGPTAAVAVVVALSLGVIAAALVKLAGESGPPPAAITRTVTTLAASTPSTPAAIPPAVVAPSTTVPRATPPAAKAGSGTLRPGTITIPPRGAGIPGVGAGALGTTPLTKQPRAQRKTPSAPPRNTIEELNHAGSVGGP